MFFALKGANFDGNEMAEAAAEKDASFIVIDDARFAFVPKSILVEDALSTLQSLAKHHRAQQSFEVLGITGSNGKTTTKELINNVLSKKYKAYATQGNYNNHIGVPLTILNAPSDSDLWIIEMGANQPGDIASLCEICQPTIGLITNIGLAHLEKLIDQNGVYREKTALFNYVRKRNGNILINDIDPYLHAYAEEHSNSISIFYDHEKCGYGKLSQLSHSSGLLSLSLNSNTDEDIPFSTHLSGTYNRINVAAAFTVGFFFEVSMKEAIQAIESYMPQNMRSQRVKTDKNEIIIDTYNANPSSMAISLGEFIHSADKNSLVILGDMLELGIDSTKYHQQIYDQLIDSNIDFYLVGEVFRSICTMEDKAFHTVMELKNHLQSHTIVNKRLFIKGSRGMQLEKIVELL